MLIASWWCQHACFCCWHGHICVYFSSFFRRFMSFLWPYVHRWWWLVSKCIESISCNDFSSISRSICWFSLYMYVGLFFFFLFFFFYLFLPFCLRQCRHVTDASTDSLRLVNGLYLSSYVMLIASCWRQHVCFCLKYWHVCVYFSSFFRRFMLFFVTVLTYICAYLVIIGI